MTQFDSVFIEDTGYMGLSRFDYPVGCIEELTSARRHKNHCQCLFTTAGFLYLVSQSLSNPYLPIL